jgi:hypothetical protein
MPVMDRLKEAFRSLSRSTARPPYAGPSRAKLVQQAANLRRVDVVPDTSDLPPMANIPLKVGIPGLDITLPNGELVQVQFEDGRPDRPFATLWDPGEAGAVPLKAVWHIRRLEIGGPCNPVQDGVVTGQGNDPYTGLPYWMLGNASAVVGAKK